MKSESRGCRRWASRRQAVAQGGPSLGVTVLMQSPSNDLDESIGDGNEQVAFGAFGSFPHHGAGSWHRAAVRRIDATHRLQLSFARLAKAEALAQIGDGDTSPAPRSELRALGRKRSMDDLNPLPSPILGVGRFLTSRASRDSYVGAVDRRPGRTTVRCCTETPVREPIGRFSLGAAQSPPSPSGSAA